MRSTMHLPIYQLSDVAEGLNYLHSCNVVHGDLKGVCDRLLFCFTAIPTPRQSNILVDAAGRARITNIGLVMVTLNLDLIRNASDKHGHCVRWIAPEILDTQGRYSKEGDVFSFAMVTIEVRCI